MSNSPTPLPPRKWPEVVLRRADQATLGLILFVALGLLAGHWGYQRFFRSGLIEIEQTQLPLARFETDINRADWPELALLPGVGETLAKRIVENRLASGPFRGHEDLRRVRGIGPKTLDGMRHYLAPLSDPSTTVSK